MSNEVQTFTIPVVEGGFSSNCEAFPIIAEKFKNYFTRGTNHATGMLQENGIYIYFYPVNYADIFGEATCAKCPLKEECQQYVISLGTLRQSVFDWRLNSKPSHGAITTLNGKFLGAYCKKKNIILATDWSHWTIEAGKISDEILKVLPLEKKERSFWVCTFGADPEFEMLDSQTRYHVIRPFGVGGTSPTTKIGVDGAGAQVELRPDPETEPLKLVENLQALIKECGHPLSVIGDVYPLGGHIHIGFPQEIRETCTMHRQTFCKVYDYFLGRPLINLSGKARGGYKQMTSFETKNWGFEYRTCPSAWMLNPQIALIFIKLVKGITEELVNKGTLIVHENTTSHFPSDEDFLRYITLDELHYYKNFGKNFVKQKVLPSINSRWQALDPGVSTSFHGLWADEVMNVVIARVKAIPVKGAYAITLYGLGGARGTVTAGWQVPGCETVVIEGTASQSYGIPYMWRMDEFPEVSLNALISKITEDFKTYDNLDSMEE